MKHGSHLDRITTSIRIASTGDYGYGRRRYSKKHGCRSLLARRGSGGLARYSFLRLASDYILSRKVGEFILLDSSDKCI